MDLEQVETCWWTEVGLDDPYESLLIWVLLRFYERKRQGEHKLSSNCTVTALGGQHM